MAFEGFSEETSTFLWELKLNNERSWFLEHKEQFERVLNTPFKELAADTAALARARWPKKDIGLHVARIYRDARRLFGRGPYKERLWFTLHSGDIHSGGPVFWFELSAVDYSYGVGFWEMTPLHAEVYRRMIDANPESFKRIVRRVNKGGYILGGPEYKKPKGERGPLLDPWYNRQRVSVEKSEAFGGELFDPGLPGILTDAFAYLMPLYDMMLSIHQTVRAKDSAADRDR